MREDEEIAIEEDEQIEYETGKEEALIRLRRLNYLLSQGKLKNVFLCITDRINHFNKK